MNMDNAKVVSGATENHLNGNISPGEKQSGIAMFDILKEGDFKFEFSGFGKNRGIWTFTRENIQPSSIRTKTSHVLSVAYFGGS
ncbi:MULTISPECIES: hypothetical protein [Priestia]|uniref:hypothetical protein n=2 Tax=Priestia TaxID=2800373 RepID=UPI002FFEC5E2